MKHNTTEITMEEIESRWKRQEDFMESLKARYPDMFTCKWVLINSSVPVGWESIIENLCGAINSYVTGTTRSRPKNDFKSKFRLFKYQAWSRISRRINRLINPYRSFMTKEEREKSLGCTITKDIYEKVKQTKRYALQNKINSLHKYFTVDRCYEHYTPPAVSIAQIKEKFGTLRFYYDGGDAEVDGMVRFAEYLCNKTCQETGNEGELYVRNRWYRTLSEEKAKEHGYTLVSKER